MDKGKLIAVESINSGARKHLVDSIYKENYGECLIIKKEIFFEMNF